MSEVLHLAERYWCGRPRLLRLLDDIEASETCRETIYVPAEVLRSADLPQGVREATALAGESETGLAVFVEDRRVTAVSPPFPLTGEIQAQGAATTPLRELLGARMKVAVVLIRLGRYAVGVLEGEKLVASKTDTRYVKNRHRAGGTSQRRFERSRERLVRELFDKACRVTRDVLSPRAKGLDHVLLGGDKMVVKRFIDRCSYLKELEDKRLSRRLAVDLPNQRALEGIGREVWKSRVAVLEPGP